MAEWLGKEWLRIGGQGAFSDETHRKRLLLPNVTGGGGVLVISTDSSPERATICKERETSRDEED